MHKKVGVAFSGGIDSLTSCSLLKSSGYEVIAFHALLATDTVPDSVIQGADLADVPLEIIDLHTEFRNTVIKSFRSEILKGRTPNPCAFCNREIKFGLLFDAIKSRGMDFMATGHYAQINEELHITRGLDRKKDQSYFLWRVNPQVRDQILFPMGTKNREFAVATAQSMGFKFKPSGSQDICFATGSYEDLLAELEIHGEEGNIISPDGTVLGRHHGLEHYTTGQRKGIGIAAKEPLYVIGKDLNSNVLIVGPQSYLEAKMIYGVEAVWAQNKPVSGHYMVSVRYRTPPYPAEVIALPNGKVQIIFKESVSAVPPGQAAVFYLGDTVVGGAWIDEVFSHENV
ncbi:tRNA 2-thiouridine(34) synthase MnmA [Myxococcota bacterium]|nr:tRNA 2-thiouridine(34) synthase MnmA [Myxococcota bacterium]MBU1380787.1 tRNA 2-thiouridine(34) synthase MnmA [Myxococcota bacterium]MBU1498921.1 tRNA 2-thiouridine(34) synthase MnmA [Myxococcota bacterium]